MDIKHSKNLIQPTLKLSKINGISWSPNKMKLAIASEDKNIYLFDEQGNHKNKFSTNRVSEVYEIVQILFDQKSEKLAVARSDNLILVYNLGINWEYKESISQGFNVEAKPNCMIVSKGNQNGIIFGLANGKVGFLDMDEIYDLYSYSSPCVSISSSFNGNYIISGHTDYFILIYDIQNRTLNKLCKHSCIPKCLGLIKNSYIFLAGNNKRVNIYNEKGKFFQNFDYSSYNDTKEFEFFSINTSGDAIALGNYNSIYIFFYNESKHLWQNFTKKIENYFPITSICWKPDGTALVVGNLVNSVDIFEVIINKTLIKDKSKKFNILIDQNLIKVMNNQTNKCMVINSKYSSLFIIMSKIFLDNFITIFLNKSLILGNFDKEKYSEILWTKTGKEVFSFNNPNICIMYTNESLTLVEYGKNEALINYSTKEKDKAIKQRNLLKAANLVILYYNKITFDNNLINNIISDLNQARIYQKLGELYEKFGDFQKALDAYKKANCLDKVNELEKRNINHNVQNQLTEERNIKLSNLKIPENSPIQKSEPETKEKELQEAIKANEWKKAVELIDKIPNVNHLFFIDIGRYFESIKEYEKAQDYYIKGMQPMLAFNMYIKLSQETLQKFEEGSPQNSNEEINTVINKYKPFFEDIENKIKQLPENKKQFNDEEKENIINKLTNFKISLFNLVNIITSKKEENKLEKEKNEVIKKVFDEQITNKGNNNNELKEEDIFIFIDSSNSIEEIEKVLNLSKDLCHLLYLILMKFEHISKIYFDKRTYLFIDKIKVIETNSLQKVKEIHESLLQKEKGKKIFCIKFENTIKKYIEYFKDQDIPNLLLLKEMIINHKKYGNELKGFNEMINHTIKKTLFNLDSWKRIN